MSPFGETPEVPAAERANETERHETVAREIVENLRSAGYFHEGETAEVFAPEPGTSATWAARCVACVYDRKALPAAEQDPGRKEHFPADDSLREAFLAAGYRVSICPGDESEDPNMCGVEYFLYAQEK